MTAHPGFLSGSESCNFLRRGTWRSPVAHLNGVQGVAGSNPAVPTQRGMPSLTTISNSA